VDDKVLFTNWAGDEYKDRQGEQILIMREEDILAVIG
jgi:co-chaperonin GroES (HSP10)